MSKNTTLYIHIPFCSKKCYYCSFVVVIGQESKVGEYINTLSKEAKRYDGYKIKHVYIGGGTPSLLPAVHVEQLFEMIHSSFDVCSQAEITLEANPEGLDASLVQAWYASGVNRISLGVQTMNDVYLRQLGRIHDAEQVPKALTIIRDAGFSNVNCDLMFGFPGQTEAQVGEDVDRLLDFRPEHISLYSLTIDPRSRFHTDQININAHQQADQYSLILDAMQSAGYHHYEVSNFARPGFESRHNRHYWEMGDYIGLGVGAHSYLNGVRFANDMSFSAYIKRIQTRVDLQTDPEPLNKESRLAEAIAFGLRMMEGVNIASLEQRFECSLDKDRRAVIQQLIGQKLLVQEAEKTRVTRDGLMVLDEISARLI